MCVCGVQKGYGGHNIFQSMVLPYIHASVNSFNIVIYNSIVLYG